MPGRPRRTAMVNALFKMTRDYFEDESHTALDFAVAWVETGRTLVDLAKHISSTINGGTGPLKPGQFDISRHMLASYLDEVGGEGTSVKLSAARRTGAHSLVEDGLRTLDDGADDRDVVNANVRRLEGRERLAAVWNKEFAKAGNQTSIMLSFGQLHLDALRSRALPATATISQSAEGAEPVDAVEEPEGA